jgi:hypothetical protein
MKVIARDVYGNSATAIGSFSAENEMGGYSIPFRFYLVAGSVVLIVIAVVVTLLALVASNMEKRRKKSIPDGDESPKV